MDIVKHAEEFAHVYKHGVLSPANDYQLVMGLDKFSRTAGILPKYVYRSMFDFVGDAEVNWMRDYRSHIRNGIHGCCLVGQSEPLKQVSAMVGCAIRNYIDAKVMTLQEVLDARKVGDPIGFELVAVPNFFVSKAEGGDVPSWQSSQLLSWLYERYASGHMTILYVSNLNGLATGYGSAFKTFILDNYVVIGG